MATTVMGVVNVTPDSFFDGGRYLDPDVAIAHGLELLGEGADLLDIGGESTRPGADPVDEQEDRRVLPVVAALAPHCRVSIDTTKPGVAEAAIAVGATLLNDVSGTLAPVAARHRVGLVVMHMRGTPKTMQDEREYDDLVTEVFGWLAEAARAARNLGVTEVYVDPGIGFAKGAAQSLTLLGTLPELVAAGEPVLVGLSRKSFLARLSGTATGEDAPPDGRFDASLAAATYAMTCGVAMVRTHDVAPCVDAARLVAAVTGELDPAELMVRAPLAAGAC